MTLYEPDLFMHNCSVLLELAMWIEEENNRIKASKLYKIRNKMRLKQNKWMRKNDYANYY